MTVEQFRNEVDTKLDLFGMAQFSRGFESCIEALEELSDHHYNKGNKQLAETLRWAAKELLGENE